MQHKSWWKWNTSIWIYTVCHVDGRGVEMEFGQMQVMRATHEQVTAYDLQFSYICFTALKSLFLLSN